MPNVIYLNPVAVTQARRVVKQYHGVRVRGCRGTVIIRKRRGRWEVKRE